MRGYDSADGGRYITACEEEVLGQGTERHKTELRRGEVAFAVAPLLLPPLVVRLAVTFDDQPPLNEEVDAPDAGDDDLGLVAQAELTEDQPHERLAPRFRGGVSEAEDCAVAARKTAEYVPHLVPGHQTGVQNAVDGGNGGARLLTSNGLPERVMKPDCRESLGRLAQGRPMQAQARSVSRGEATRRIVG